MRSTILLMLVINLFTGKGYAQDTLPGKKTGEIYVGLNNLFPTDFSINWKKQLKNNLFFKLGLVELRYNIREENYKKTTYFPSSAGAFSSGIQAGIEFRKEISNVFTFFHGPDLGFTYQYTFVRSDNPGIPEKLRKDKTFSYHPGISWSFGFIFPLKNRFYLSSVISPGIRINYREYRSGAYRSDNYETLSAGFGLKNSALVSLVYRY